MAEVKYQDDWLTIWHGDCRDAMAAMPEQSVQTIITSPPFYGLRDYGNGVWDGGETDCDHTGVSVCSKCGATRIEPTIWGGEVDHAHVWGPSLGEVRSTAQGGLAFTGNGAPETRLPGLEAAQPTIASQGNYCECGAWRGALGLEPTPDLYVEHLAEVFRQAWRVLRDDGILWLNLGDSYARAQDTNVPQTKKVAFPDLRPLDPSAVVGSSDGKVGRADRPGSRAKAAGLKPKDLVGIPWMAAFALRNDGWYLRQDIVWSKPNAMPESVEDRPSRSHEFIFMLTKKPAYYYDHIAVKEPASESTLKTVTARMAAAPTEDREYQHDSETRMGKRSPNRVWSDQAAMQRLLDGRNKRDVWSIPTVPYPGAHYAVFPPKLVEPMIQSATSEHGCCPVCGTPWEREVDVESFKAEGRELRPNKVPGQGYAQQSGNYWTPPVVTQKGWVPGCDHDEYLDPVPCVVLDPFGGSGTVGMVSQQLGRKAILIDLNPNYVEQQLERNAQTPLGL